MAGKSNRAGRRYLILKGNRWWFRRGIPADCQSHFSGLKFYVRNLETGDLAQAQSVRDLFEDETTRLFTAIRTGKVIALATLSAREEGLNYRQAIQETAAGGDELTLEAVEFSAEEAFERLKGDHHKTAFADALHGREAVPAHLDAYLKVAQVTAKTAQERRGLIGRMATWAAGQHPPLTLDRIDRRAAGRYVSEVIDPMHPVTQGKHLTALRGYWKYLAARGHVAPPKSEPRNSGWPWNDQRIEGRGKRAERGSREQERPFTDSEIKLILYSPAPDRMDPTHISAIRDVLKVSLLSGMRMAEVLTLWVDEVCEGPEGAGLVFDIQQGKTEAAARAVPVHPDLMELVKRRTAGKPAGSWLFHELSAERDPGDTFGKRFRRYRLKVGVDDAKTGKRRSLVNFHSARRWFVTQARHAGQAKETIADVVGHVPDNKDVTFGVYSTGASPQQKRACIEAVRLPE